MASQTGVEQHLTMEPFDSDSVEMGIDSFASCCMSPHRDMFKQLSVEKHLVCKGIAEGLRITGTGTLTFSIDDNQGITSHVEIPGSKYVPDLPMVLLSPQHWNQYTDDRVSAMTNGNGTNLRFQGRTRTIPMATGTNVPRLRTSPGTIKLQAMMSLADHVGTESLLEKEHVAFAGELEDGELDVFDPDEQPMSVEPPPKHNTADPVDDDRAKLTVDDPQADLLRWHYRLGHSPFRLIKALAKIGLLPRKLASAPEPKCATCLFAAMTKKP